MRILYAAGPGDVIAAHKSWQSSQSLASEMSLTYSGQFADFCREIGAHARIVSSHSRREVHGPFIVEHRPKKPHGNSAVRYHVSQLAYGLLMLRGALAHRAGVAVIHSDTTQPFVLSLFRLFGIRVVPVLHNTPWPTGYSPKSRRARIMARLDGLFFRWGANATIGISPECLRQVSELAGGKNGPIHEMRCQYKRDYFAAISPPPREITPLRILFAGRLDRNKGALDVITIAGLVEQKHPGQVQWDICGSGNAVEAMQKAIDREELRHVIHMHGWTPPDAMRDIIGRSHLSIVPTRSDFAEGLAKTAVEAVLAGRPVITSAVVPALEILRPACFEALTDDVLSYVVRISEIIANPNVYERACAACLPLQDQFYDRELGHATVLRKVLLSNEGKVIRSPSDRGRRSAAAQPRDLIWDRSVL